MKGVGKIYQQTVIDTYSRVAFAQLYTQKTAITAAHMLNENVLPWFETQEIPVLRVLTDRGTEYCGKIENHAYQLYLAVENIDHSKTKAYSPQTNGIVERFHKTMKNEFYDVAFRKKLYHSLAQLQEDVNNWLSEYNQLRPHSGKYCYGKTPMQTFNECKKIAMDKDLEKRYHQDETKLLLGQPEDVVQKDTSKCFRATQEQFAREIPCGVSAQGVSVQSTLSARPENGVDLSNNNL